MSALINDELGPLMRGEQNARPVVTNLVPKVNSLLRAYGVADSAAAGDCPKVSNDR
ncbi:MAG: hypothetical protein HY332_24875 [Chloroflexi bacterium]|nr:hypothetical protein [Chloroflexota bacterium]